MRRRKPDVDDRLDVNLLRQMAAEHRAAGQVPRNPWHQGHRLKADCLEEAADEITTLRVLVERLYRQVDELAFVAGDFAASLRGAA